jgi:hypothetical protein
MSASVASLLTRTWWRYDPAEQSWFTIIYRGFNQFEGAAWYLLAVLVAIRFAKHRRSKWDIVYCVAFASFGASDFREAYRIETRLIAAKLINLIALFALRWYLIKRFDPTSRTY